MYTHTRVYCIMFPFLQHHQEEVMIFFLQENDLHFRGIPGKPLAPHRALALGCQKPGA